MKHCKYCNRDLPESKFAHHPSTKDRLCVKCKDCQVEYNRQRRTAKPKPPPQPRQKREKVTAEEKAARMIEWKSLVIGRKHPHDAEVLK